MPRISGAWVKIWKMVALACSMIIVGILAWYSFHGNSAPRHPGLFAGSIFILLSALIRAKVLELPAGIDVPFFNVFPKASDVVKAGISLLLLVLWTVIVRPLIPDSPVGVAIIIVPDVVFLVAAIVCISNGLSRSQR